MRTKVSFRVIFIDRNGNEYPDYLCNEYDEAKEQSVFEIISISDFILKKLIYEQIVKYQT